MTPEAAQFLEKSRDDLNDARKIARIGLAHVAARSAYYAAFHAAEALIVEHTGKIAKTHSGVRSEFARLLKDTSTDREFIVFLARAYELKSRADYGTGNEAAISSTAADAAIQTAARFVDYIASLLGPVS